MTWIKPSQSFTHSTPLRPASSAFGSFSAQLQSCFLMTPNCLQTINKSEMLPNSEEFEIPPHDWCGETEICLVFCCKICFVAIHANLSRNLFHCHLCAFVWRKIESKIVTVEKNYKYGAGNSLVYGIREILWWKISSYMMKNQHRCDEISADRTIPIPLQPPHLLQFDTLMLPYRNEKLISVIILFKFYVNSRENSTNAQI